MKLNYVDMHMGAVRDLDVNPDLPNFLLSGGDDGHVHYMDCNQTIERFSTVPLRSHCVSDSDAISSVALDPTHPLMASWTTDGGRFERYDLRAGAVVAKAVASDPGLFAHAPTGNGMHFALGYGTGVLQIYDSSRMVPLYSIPKAIGGGAIGQIISVLDSNANQVQVVAGGVGGVAKYTIGDPGSAPIRMMTFVDERTFGHFHVGSSFGNGATFPARLGVTTPYGGLMMW